MNQMCNLSDIGKETAVADAGVIMLCLKGISDNKNKALDI